MNCNKCERLRLARQWKTKVGQRLLIQDLLLLLANDFMQFLTLQLQRGLLYNLYFFKKLADTKDLV